MGHGTLIASAALGFAAATAGAAEIVSIHIFENADNAPLLGLDVSLEVTDAGGGIANLSLINNSWGQNQAGRISEIYFELSDISQSFLISGIDENNPEKNGPQFVDFAEANNYQKPDGGLPGWNSGAETLYQIGQASGNMWGVHTAESLELQVNYGNGMTYGEFLNSIVTQDGFRIAMHIQSVGTDDESSIWGVTSTVIPLPSAVVLAGAGLGIVAGRRRRTDGL